MALRFTDSIKRQWPEHLKLFEEWEQYLVKYNDRFRRRLIAIRRKVNRPMGSRSSHLLLTSLTRARLLTGTVIHCVNGGFAPGMFLAARAHWEMTALIAHLLVALRRFYEGGRRDEEEFELAMSRMFFGQRSALPEAMRERTLAINVVTLLGSVRKVLGEIEADEIDGLVKECYDSLSEYCHPNLLARTSGVSVSKDGRVTDFDARFVLSSDEIQAGLTYGTASHDLFIAAYDQCFELLHEKERGHMPALEGRIREQT